MASYAKITITTRPEVITHFMNDGQFDFNKAVKMPSCLDLKQGTVTHDAIIYYLSDALGTPLKQSLIKKYFQTTYDKDYIDYLTNKIDNKINMSFSPDYQPVKLYLLGKKYVDNYDRYGYFTWHDWRNKHWGTKWNACNSEYDENKPNRITFTTAGIAAPYPIFQIMCERFPNENIHFYCHYEDSGEEELCNDHGKLKQLDMQPGFYQW